MKERKTNISVLRRKYTKDSNLQQTGKKSPFSNNMCICVQEIDYINENSNSDYF